MLGSRPGGARTPERRGHGVETGPERRSHGVETGPERRSHGVEAGPGRRIHVVGCERSGTTLLLEMMAAGFAIDARCEREQSLFEPGPPAAVFLSKKPLDILRLETVFRRDERLFVLYTVRDPRSVVTSRHSGRPDRHLSDFPTWAACERAAARLDGHPRFHRVRYERLVREPDRVQAEIAGSLPFLRPTGAFSRFHETAAPTETGRRALGGVRPPDQGRLEAWRRDLPRLKAQVLANPELARAVVEAGYESDDEWLGVLAGVEPDTGAGRSRTPARLRSFERAVRYWWKTRRYLARMG